MSALTFKPRSVEFAKRKARQLQRAFPGLLLSKAQETTAAALGYSCWFDLCQYCSNLESTSLESTYDEDLETASRLARRHHQFCALVDIGHLPAGLAECFVRAWGLTTKTPSTNLNKFVHPYVELLDQLNLEREPADSDEDIGYDLLDEDGPNIVAEGVIKGDIGLKHDYYVLDQKVFSTLPPYLQGNSCCFLDFVLLRP